MADIISRLRLESGEFDSKIKRAGQELMAYSEHCRKTGLVMGFANKDARDFAQSLGNMQTTSTTARGKINELSDAFVNLRMMYKQMPDEEKNNQFGKNLAASLDQLKTRIQEAKKDLSDVTAELNGTSSGGKGGFLSGIGDKMGGAMQVFAGNLMTKAAGAVANLGSEIYDMMQQGVELARQGEGIRIAFERLGRGDILDGLREATHGTVTDLELMKAAVKFNDFKLPVEELGTMLAFAQQKAKDTGQSVDYMVDSIVTGLGRKSLMILDNLGLSASEIKERMAQTGDMTKAVGDIIRDQMSKAGDYVETAADRAQQATVAQQNKMEELGRKIMPLAEETTAMWNSIKIGGLSVIANVLDPMISKFTHLGRLMAAQGMSSNGGGGSMNRMIGMLGTGQGDNARSTYNRQVAAFNRSINARRADVTAVERWQGGERSQGLQETINRLRDKYGADFQRVVRDNLDATINNLNEYKKRAQQLMSSSGAGTSPVSDTTNEGTTGSRRGSSASRQQTEMQKNQTRINDLTQQYVSLMAAASEAGKPLTDEQQKQTSEIQRQIAELEKRNGLLGLYQEQAQGRLLGVDPKTGGLSMTGGFTGFATPQSMSDVVRQRGGNLLDDKAMKAVQKNIDKQMKGVGNIADEWSGVASAIGAVGNAMAGIEDPAAKVLGIVAQAIATVALTFSKSLAGTVTPWDWIAAAAAGTATMISTISAIHSATGYAEGGIIKGNSYSGDNLMAMGPNGLIGLNAGEIVLNKSQQNNLASQLQGGGMQNLNLTATIKGEQIRLVLNNNGRRTGRGEYVQSTRRRG